MSLSFCFYIVLQFLSIRAFSLIPTSFSIIRLLTPPDTPLFPTLDKDSQISVKSETETRNSRSTALKPRVRTENYARSVSY